MKIWIVSTSDPIPFVDRGQRLCRYGQLAVLMAEAGHDVRFWVSSFDHIKKQHRKPESPICEPAPHLTVELLHAPGYRRNVSINRIRHNRALSREFRQLANQRDEKPDILLAGIPCLEMSEAATEYAQERGRPIVVDIEDIWPDLYLTALPLCLVPLGRACLWTEFRRARRLLRKATAVTAVSRSYLEWALKHAGRPAGPQDGIYPLGFADVLRPPREQLDHGAASLRRQYNIAQDRFIVVFVGQFGACYDLETVVNAARLLGKSGNCPIHFLLVGTGDKAALLREQARGLSNLTFCGWLGQEAILSVLHLAKVGLATYTARATQSLPFKPFEYMAASLPIVSSLNGELAEIIASKGIGLQYKAGNVQSLAEAILTLAQSELLRQKMGKLARQVHAERYDTTQIYARLIQMLETMATTSEKTA